MRRDSPMHLPDQAPAPAVPAPPRRPPHELMRAVPAAVRRKGWFLENADHRKIANALLAGGEYLARRRVLRAWPVILKVDISPVCNLHCTVCVHATPSEHSPPSLRTQEFRSSQRMSVEDFARIADEVAGRTMAVSLYYLGDPLVHPHLDEICRVAARAGLNSHISTNFSFCLSPERIEALVTSGLTHMTVSVDGLTQDLYARTRVGGRIDLVLANLERLLRCRERLGRVYPKVEVQFVKFQHNVHELEEAERRAKALGVDQFSHYWGALDNYGDSTGEALAILEPLPDRVVPQCLWPYFAMLVKFDGDVIPCCAHRIMAQYDSRATDKRIVGNVFSTGVREVWNSPKYQAMRRLVSSPRTVASREPLGDNFCDGCPKIFLTDVDSRACGAAAYRWEELYELDSTGRVVRRPPGTGSGWQPVALRRTTGRPTT